MFYQWSLVKQSAPQATGPIGPIFRWFVGRTDEAMSKGLPAPSRPRHRARPRIRLSFEPATQHSSKTVDRNEVLITGQPSRRSRANRADRHDTFGSAAMTTSPPVRLILPTPRPQEIWASATPAWRELAGSTRMALSRDLRRPSSQSARCISSGSMYGTRREVDRRWRWSRSSARPVTTSAGPLCAISTSEQVRPLGRDRRQDWLLSVRASSAASEPRASPL